MKAKRGKNYFPNLLSIKFKRDQSDFSLQLCQLATAQVFLLEWDSHNGVFNSWQVICLAGAK